MDCHLFRMLVQNYYDGEMDAVERAEYEKHRSLCNACLKVDRRFAEIFSALDGVPVLEPSNGFNENVMAAVDISRYRVGVMRKACNAIGAGWSHVPAPVRKLLPAGAAIALFITIFRPFYFSLISIGERAVALLGSGLIVLKELAERSRTIVNYLSSATNYKVAGEILLKTLQRMVNEVPILQIGLIVAVLLVVLFIAVKTARIVWKKGETNVGIF